MVIELRLGRERQRDAGRKPCALRRGNRGTLLKIGDEIAVRPRKTETEREYRVRCTGATGRRCLSFVAVRLGVISEWGRRVYVTKIFPLIHNPLPPPFNFHPTSAQFQASKTAHNTARELNPERPEAATTRKLHLALLEGVSSGKGGVGVAGEGSAAVEDGLAMAVADGYKPSPYLQEVVQVLEDTKVG